MTNLLALALCCLSLMVLKANAGVTWDFYRKMADVPLPELCRQEGETELLLLVKKANLGSALDSPGAKTLFGPTNAGFQTLSQKLRHYLSNNITFLTDVLKYHVLGSKVLSTDLKNELIASALDGKPVITAAGKQVTKPDVMASNGVLHEIGGVMMPADYTITEAVVKDSSFSTLAKAVSAAGLADTLSGPGPFTMFAPNNDAFAKVPADVLNKLLSNKTALTSVLTYHVVPGTFFSAGLESGAVKTVNGQTVNVNVGKDGVMVNKAKVIVADVNLVNGVGHEIDTVLLPPGFTWKEIMDRLNYKLR